MSLSSKHVKKLKNYMKNDRPKKFKSYAKKHKIAEKLKDVWLKKDRNLLHHCCKHGTGAVLVYLLREEVSAGAVDDEGNLPIHAALQRSLKQSSAGRLEAAQTCYQELVLPLLEKHPEQLEAVNNEGISCRQLLNSLLASFQTQQGGKRNLWEDDDEPPGHMTDRKWREKLADEMQDECSASWDGFQDDFAETGTNRESYDAWASRISRERASKLNRDREKSGMAESGRKRKHEKKPKSRSEEDLEEARAKMRRKYEENQKLRKEDSAKRQKVKYESRYKHLLETDSSVTLTFADIPWPSSKAGDKDIAVLFSDITKGSKEFRKYLREQQVRWHPDKFMQRFGNRLHDPDKERVLDRVTVISQALNKMSE